MPGIKVIGQSFTVKVKTNPITSKISDTVKVTVNNSQSGAIKLENNDTSNQGFKSKRKPVKAVVKVKTNPISHKIDTTTEGHVLRDQSYQSPPEFSLDRDIDFGEF